MLTALFWIFFIPSTIAAFSRGLFCGMVYEVMVLVMAAVICALTLITVSTAGFFFSSVYGILSLGVLYVTVALAKGDPILTFISTYGMILYCIFIMIF